MRRVWTYERLLKAAERVVVGRPDCTLHEFCREVDVSPATVAKRAGGWRKLRAAAGGRERTLPRKHTKASVLAAYRELIADEGDVSLDRLRESHGVDRNAIQNTWGGAAALRKAAGLKGRVAPRRSVYDTEDLIDEYCDVWDKIGRRPGLKDLDLHGRFKANAYLSRWGTAAQVQAAVIVCLKERAEWFERAKRKRNGEDVDVGAIPSAVVVRRAAGTGRMGGESPDSRRCGCSRTSDRRF